MDNAQPSYKTAPHPPRHAAMDAINRRFALYRTGKTQRELATEMNVSQAAISGAISGLYTSAPVALRLAQVTGISINELFPDGRYSHIEQEAA